jgi:hypothetical protein
LACPERKVRRRRRSDAAGIAAAPGRVEQRGGRRKEGGEGETDQWDPAVSERERKENGGGGVGWRGEGLMGCWAAGPERSRAGFVFFFFQTSFSNHFSTLIQFKPFQTFLKNFIDFLETAQATKNHASQLMMHIHLLSLSLLNYL